MPEVACEPVRPTPARRFGVPSMICRFHDIISFLFFQETLMARNTETPPIAPKLRPSVVEMRRGIERLEQRVVDLDKFNIGTVQSIDTPPELVGLSKSIEGTLAKCFGENTAEYNRFIGAADVVPWFPGVSNNYPLVRHVVEQINQKLAKAKAILREAINALKDDIADAEADEKPTSIREATSGTIVRTQGVCRAWPR